MTVPDERFWTVIDEFLVTGRLQEGTIMSHKCVRTVDDNEFVAMAELSTGNLIVKLPKGRVAELIAAGDGSDFAPAGRVFREWVAVREFDPETWANLVEESIAFVSK